MSKVCEVSGKRPMSGNSVSHSNRKTKRRFLPNLQKKRIWNEETESFITLKVTAKMLKTIDKKGIAKVLAEKAAKAK